MLGKKFSKMSFIVVMSILCLNAFVSAASNSKERKKDKKYRPQNGVISLKGELLGGEFRVTNVIPLRGDFSKYQRLEIVRLESLIGNSVPDTVIDKYTDQVCAEFKKSGHFEHVAIMDSFHRPAPNKARLSLDDDDFRRADSLESPMLSWNELMAHDEQRARAARLEAESAKNAHTLVVAGQVIDYAKGNKYLDLLRLDLGSAILVVRFSYYDKETGEEVGRQIVSSQAGNKLIPVSLSARTATAGVVEGLVDQITRRQAGAER